MLKKDLWENSKRTYYDLPRLLRLSHFISGTHFGICQSSDNEDNQTWTAPVLGLLTTLLVPLTVAGWCRCSEITEVQKRDTSTSTTRKVNAEVLEKANLNGWLAWRPARNGKCFVSSLSSIASSMISFNAGTQREDWYTCSFGRSFLTGVHTFFRPC